MTLIEFCANEPIYFEAQLIGTAVHPVESAFRRRSIDFICRTT
jgi:hypothetical protein